MKRFVHFLFAAVLLFLSFGIAPRGLAACRRSSAEACTSGNFLMYTLTFPKDPASNNPFHSGDPSCTHPVVDSGTSVGVCCDNPNEINTTDSLRAPPRGRAPAIG